MPLIGKGKRTREWDNVRAELKIEFEARDITRCELRLPGCWRDNALGFAHTKKRRNLEGDDIRRVVLACNPCHDRVEFLGESRMQVILERIINRREFGGLVPLCACGHSRAEHIRPAAQGPAVVAFFAAAGPLVCGVCQCKAFVTKSERC